MHAFQLTANTREDYDRKFKLLHDTFDVVDMEGKLAGDETSIGGFDLIWKDGPVVAHPGSKYTSMLGADFSQSLAPAISRAAPTPVTAAAGAGGSAPGTPSTRSAGKRGLSSGSSTPRGSRRGLGSARSRSGR